MLAKIKRKLHKIQKKTTSFDELYTDYIIAMYQQSLKLEMEYLLHHNKVDILKLDKWMNNEFKEAIL